MRDRETTMAEMRDRVEAFIRAREWESFHHPKDLAISLSLEAAELLEHFQWEDKRPLSTIRQNGRMVEELSEELADILHYLCNFANVLDIDLAAALERKMAKNELKYPVDASKGRANKYTAYVGANGGELTDDEI